MSTRHGEGGDAIPPPVIPVELTTLRNLYRHLGVSIKEKVFLERYILHRYRVVSLSKRRGGVRTLMVPEQRLKFLQRKLLLLLLERVYVPRSPVHGFTKDRSPISNARMHARRPHLLTIDIKEFFPSIGSKRVFGLLQTIGVPGDVSAAMTHLCTLFDQLPQGSPVSPIISNMICFRLDKDLMSFAKKNRLRYTRYADDITFSSYANPASLFEGQIGNPGKIDPSQLSKDLKIIFQSNGFQINSDKIWYSGPRDRKEVTGLIVNQFVNIKRRFIRNTRAMIFDVLKNGYAAAQEKYESKGGVGQLEKSLRGRIEWIAQVRGRSFSSFRKLALSFNALFPNSSVHVSPTNQEICQNAIWIIEHENRDDPVQGTAFFLSGIGLVTAYHVVEGLKPGDAAEIYNIRNVSEKFRVTVQYSCPHRDLAVLEHSVPADKYMNLGVSFIRSASGDGVTAFGFPDYGPGDVLAPRKGSIIALYNKRVMSQAVV